VYSQFEHEKKKTRRSPLGECEDANTEHIFEHKNKRTQQSRKGRIMTNALSPLVGPRIEGVGKWSVSVLGADDCIYGIPYNARRVVKFNPVDKSRTEIGPESGCVAYWLIMVVFIVLLLNSIGF